MSTETKYTSSFIRISLAEGALQPPHSVSYCVEDKYSAEDRCTAGDREAANLSEDRNNSEATTRSKVFQAKRYDQLLKLVGKWKLLESV